MGVNLVSYATRRRAGMEAREQEDAVNDYGRDPIGEGKEEQVCSQLSFQRFALIALLDAGLQSRVEDVTRSPEGRR
jgi:hypothetical protein